MTKRLKIKFTFNIHEIIFIPLINHQINKKIDNKRKVKDNLYRLDTVRPTNLSNAQMCH